MKKQCLFALAILVLNVGLVAPSRAVEILRWQRLPLAVPLVVGQERIVFVDRNVRIGVPASVGERLRVQSAGGAIYLRAGDIIPPTRLQLQDVESGTLILLDIVAEAVRDGQVSLEPVRIVMDETSRIPTQATSRDTFDAPPASRETPIPVVLIRYAAQNLYAPLRTVEPVAGIGRVPLRRDLALESLLPILPVRTKALAAWRLADQWVTAVRLTNTSAAPVDLDPRALQGDFVVASFQHAYLGSAGQPTDTTVVYLVTRGHGLAESLLPTLAPFDAGINLPMKPEAADAR